MCGVRSGSVSIPNPLQAPAEYKKKVELLLVGYRAEQDQVLSE